MATAGTKIDASLWERLTDGFGAFSEGIVGFLGRFFGSSNERYIRSLGYIRNRDGSHSVVPGSLLAQVNDLEEQMKALSDEELKALTPAFRERLAQGETLEQLLPEAFAAVRESSRRYLNMRHFDSQIVGSVVLHRGNIAEMVTGEGKTLVATAPAYLNALEGQGVHIVTVNDYLARRDCEWMAPIFHGLGMTTGYIQSDMDPVARRQAYDCDITYGTNSEFGFDYLRDNMKPARWADPDYPPHLHQVQKNLNYAIIDEVDNILIDEARTPLIISGMAFGDLKRYARANEVAVKLTELERKAKASGTGEPVDEEIAADVAQAEAGAAGGVADKMKELIAGKQEAKKPEGIYFEIKEKEHTCHLTDAGIRKAEELAGVESFYTAGNMEWPHLIDNALKAHHLYHKDKQYVVMRHPETHEMSIIIVDEFTGRLMIGRQWSDGLHQAVEAKHAREGVKIKEETQTLATITLQNYFKLYNKLAGMTGTAMTEANEFWKIYKLEVIAIPTNKPLIRENFPDVIYLSEKEKWEAVVNEIERINKWDVVRLGDGTELIGTIRSETDDSMEFVTREGERRKLTPQEVADIERKGRPILIGTTDVDKSEKLSAMLKRKGIKHELLNAKPEYAAREAEIVAQAGRIGAVTIATNMAGRGTDIILGGNPEPLAWGSLKDKYPSRLDVPPAEWKQLVDDIRTKEKMAEEGRKVAEMGGLHIIGTERHEARRIDNQLRGRAGRQGDPGSSRFYLSLDDDLMRIFAGDWVKGILQRLGMEYGQSIESRMVSRRIQAAQKKREEHNFDIRKNLLEYDEVMDHQRKRVYGYRQEILEGANCKIRILKMIDEQIDLALDRFLDDDYGPSSFAEHASKQLGVECDSSDFTRSDFTEAEKTAREKALKAIPTQIHEAMETHLNLDADPKEWAWQALSSYVNSRWGLKTTERDLKKIGRDNLAEHIIALAEKAVNDIDLSRGAQYLAKDWGIKSFCDWAKAKFQIALDPKALADSSKEDILAIMREEIQKLYKQREVEFPITVAMARFMSETHRPGTLGQRYDREGLYRWARIRFYEHPRPGVPDISEETFRTESRAKLQEILLDISGKYYPATGHEDIDAHVADAFQGASVSEEEDARELADWMRQTYAIEIPPEELTEITEEAARDILWTAFDKVFRPEMKRMERSLVLNQLDTSWKNHLYTMDHLRQGIGLMGYAQMDPKTEYKRQGMKEFDSMWEGVHDKVTDTVFRMEDDESFQESLWAISAMVHEAAPQFVPNQQQQEGLANQASDKKQEPIRNRKDRVGRNDPCPCGSGKKYKNCCMRMTA